MMGQLTGTPVLTFQLADLQKILVVSSFSDDDPLKNVLTSALDAIRERWETSKRASATRTAAYRCLAA